jgi:hypothetical protein
MNLAAILGWCLLFLGSAPANPPPRLSELPQQQAPSSQTSSPPADSSGQAPKKSSRWHHKKTVPPDCTSAPAPLSPQPGSSSPSSSSEAASEGANPSQTPPAESKENDNTKSAGSANADAGKGAANKPCPPPKKVISNGGSNEPAIKLTGDASPAEQRSTEQLTSSAEANLKKISERELKPNQKETVNQIQEFLQQSKAATAAGNTEVAHDFAQKAQLLSEELANSK